MIRFFAVLLLLGWVGSGTAQEQNKIVTITNFKKTNTTGKTWKVEWSGTYTKLTDLGCGYMKWDKATFKVEQPGKTDVTVNIVSVIPPTFTANGSFSVYAIIDETMTADWVATASATIQIDASSSQSNKDEKAFTLP